MEDQSHHCNTSVMRDRRDHQEKSVTTDCSFCLMFVSKERDDGCDGGFGRQLSQTDHSALNSSHGKMVRAVMVELEAGCHRLFILPGVQDVKKVMRAMMEEV
eukprot:10252416-Ditylum_brightwellii.AAC.1